MSPYPTYSSIYTYNPGTAASGVPSAGDLYKQAMGQVQGYGNARQAELKQDYQNALGTAQQQMVSSGLSGTVAMPSMRMGYMRQYERALNDLNDRLVGQKLQVGSTFGLGGIQSEQAGQQLANQAALGWGQLALAQQQANRAQNRLAYQNQPTTAAGYQEVGGGYNYLDDWSAAVNRRSYMNPYSYV